MKELTKQGILEELKTIGVAANLLQEMANLIENYTPATTLFNLVSQTGVNSLLDAIKIKIETVSDVISESTAALFVYINHLEEKKNVR